MEEEDWLKQKDIERKRKRSGHACEEGEKN